MRFEKRHLSKKIELYNFNALGEYLVLLFPGVISPRYWGYIFLRVVAASVHRHSTAAAYVGVANIVKSFSWVNTTKMLLPIRAKAVY